MRHLFPLALIVALAACATGDVVLDRPAAGYVEDARARVAEADWSRAETVTLSLSAFQFDPSSLAFTAGRPYRLVLRNIGDGRHTFVSDGFFESIAVRHLISSDGVMSNPVLKAIEVPPKAEKTLEFVPVTPGAYPLACSVFLHETFGMEGRIAIR
jgi:uncharacterized cupredoxin-like copper-binding protein